MSEYSETILAVDTNLDVHDQQTKEWAKYGIGAVRVNSMQKAINWITINDDFFFVAINEDSVPGYLSQLHIMRDVTNAPIFAITSNYSVEKKIQVLGLGADMYDSFSAYAKQKVLAMLNALKGKDRWAERQIKPQPVLIGGDIILSPSRRVVFVGDTELYLSKKEFEIIEYLMRHKGYVVPHSQILKTIWGEEYGELDIDVLWRTMDRIRRKISKISPPNNYIKTEHGVGYKFLN